MSKLKRAEDWPEKLHEFIESRRRTAFEWGKHDCALFACDAALAMTGTDMAAAFRTSYDSALMAYRAIKDYCGDPSILALSEKIAEEHEIAEVPVLMAQRGDILLIDLEELTQQHGPALGVLGLDGWNVFFTGKDGLITIPLDKCLKAWRI